MQKIFRCEILELKKFWILMTQTQKLVSLTFMSYNLIYQEHEHLNFCIQKKKRSGGPMFSKSVISWKKRSFYGSWKHSLAVAEFAFTSEYFSNPLTAKKINFESIISKFSRIKFAAFRIQRDFKIFDSIKFSLVTD